MAESNQGLVVGIDAANLRRGGGVTHLVEVLRVVEPTSYGIAKVIVWGGSETLAALEHRPWLVRETPTHLDQGFLKRTYWQRRHLGEAVRKAGCDVLFVPGGRYASNFRPVVTMSRNLLPFDWRELVRYGASSYTMRLLFLRWAQARTFRGADGVIFLTEYARRVVTEVTGRIGGEIRVIPHGVHDRFRIEPRRQATVGEIEAGSRCAVLYVSIVDQYKHQWHVVEAVSRLRQATGLGISLDLVGTSFPPALRRLRRSLERFDPDGEWVVYHGLIPYAELHEYYAQAHLGLFASSCENMPNILMETMAAGLPIACSNRGPMPEVLGPAGVYFDPERPEDIERALRDLLASPRLRSESSRANFLRAESFSWKDCAARTFDFLVHVALARAGSKVPPLRVETARRRSARGGGG